MGTLSVTITYVLSTLLCLDSFKLPIRPTCSLLLMAYAKKKMFSFVMHFVATFGTTWHTYFTLNFSRRTSRCFNIAKPRSIKFTTNLYLISYLIYTQLIDQLKWNGVFKKWVTLFIPIHPFFPFPSKHTFCNHLLFMHTPQPLEK